VIERLLPRIADQFKTLEIKANMFATKWFLTLYGCVLPLESVFRIWDAFMLDSWEVIFRIGLAILKHSEDTLLELPIEDILVYFDSLPSEVIEYERLFNTAFSFDLSEALKGLEKGDGLETNFVGGDGDRLWNLLKKSLPTLDIRTPEDERLTQSC